MGELRLCADQTAFIVAPSIKTPAVASEVAARVCASHRQTTSQYGPRQAAYDLKKLRGKHIVRGIGHTPPL
jgi:hypothetical protein